MEMLERDSTSGPVDRFFFSVVAEMLVKAEFDLSKPMIGQFVLECAASGKHTDEG
ncbi:hypothetical protein T01_12694 [Trichinella spiralis]|uniref:Uncharacterized protein n=1 Tax=Trichinella spiralis TaxID=6334 RepID=A0A0V1BAC8_TRISP|nr:hypothetical protein T01_12694 [Trichinella spiralis]